MPEEGQRWTTLEELREAGTRITVAEVETGLWGLRATPEVGIGQQTMVVRTPEGVLLGSSGETAEIVPEAADHIFVRRL